MENLLKNLSKTGLALILIGGGVLFIVASDPPVTKCSHQVDKFEEAEAAEVSRFQKLVTICKQTNDLGGCYELFSSIRKTLGRSKTIALECLSDWGDSRKTKNFLNESMRLMMEIPWGPKGPASDAAKLSWFEGPQIELFCKLQDVYALVYGDAAWLQKRETLLAELPGFATLGRSEAWTRSMLAVNCAGYRRGAY